MWAARIRDTIYLPPYDGRGIDIRLVYNVGKSLAFKNTLWIGTKIKITSI